MVQTVARHLEVEAMTVTGMIGHLCSGGFVVLPQVLRLSKDVGKGDRDEA